MFSAQKSKRSRRFQEMDPAIFKHVQYAICPSRGLTSGEVLRRCNFPQNLYGRKIMKKKGVRSGLRKGSHRRRVQNFSLTRKNGVDFGRGMRFRHLTWTSPYKQQQWQHDKNSPRKNKVLGTIRGNRRFAFPTTKAGHAQNDASLSACEAKAEHPPVSSSPQLMYVLNKDQWYFKNTKNKTN